MCRCRVKVELAGPRLVPIACSQDCNPYVGCHESTEKALGKGCSVPRSCPTMYLERV